MNETLYVSTLNFRPRINGTATLLEAGSPFTKDVIDEFTFTSFLKTGEITLYEEEVEDAEVEVLKVEKAPVEGPSEDDLLAALKKKAKEEFGVELKQRKLETAQAAYDKLVKKAPKGIFCLEIENLADKDLDELDAIHADLCAENSLPAPDPFESIEQAIEKLTSEA